MSRNNTGNPIGSKAFPDFEDNVKNLDEAVNTSDPQWVDRFGRFRLPLMEQERQFVSDQERRDGEFQADQSSREAVFSDFLQASGYQDLGEYAPGIEITAHNQYVTFGGQPYLLKPSIPVPYTTSGEWTGDDFKLIGDGSIRQDLANPDMGAALVARAPICVDSIADLLALPGGQLKEGVSYSVHGYYQNSLLGGGVFYWSASTVREPDEGTVYNAGGGQFVLKSGSIVTPYTFGCKRDEIAGDRLQKFFDAFSLRDDYLFDITAKLQVDRGYLIAPIDGGYKEIPGYLELTVVVSELEDTVVRLATNYILFSGGIRVLAGAGGSYYVAFDMENFSRSKIGLLHCQHPRSVGVRYLAGSGINNNMATIDQIISIDSGLRSQVVSGIFVSHSGATNSTTRRANIQFELTNTQKKAIEKVGVRGVIVDIDGSPHAVTDYDEATGEMALYPGKLTDYNYADAEYKISIGGSLFTTGGDGGQLKVSLLDSRRSAISWRSTSLYGAIIDRLVSQACTVSYMNGVPPLGIGGYGDYIGNIYQERVDFQGIVSSGAGNAVIATTSGSPVEAWILEPPNRPAVAGSGNNRLQLLGFKTQYNGPQHLYTRNYPELAREDAVSVVNGDGTIDIELPLSLASMVFVDSPDTEARAIVLVSSHTTSAAARHSSAVLLTNDYQTGGATFSTVVKAGRDHLRIVPGTTDLSAATWQITETRMTEPS